MKLIPRWHQEKCWSSCIKVRLFSNISTSILKLELYLAFVAVYVLSPVWLCDPMDCSPPGSSVHGISQARILEWVAISFTKGSSWPRDQTHISCVSCIGRQILYHWVTWEAPAAKSLQSCPTLCDPIDGSPPGSAVPEILQARTLEWVAISFSNAWKWKVKEKSLSRVRPSATPWTAAFQVPPSMGFSRQEYWEAPD